MSDLTIKQFDTWPPLVTQLVDEDGPILDLDDAVTIKMRLKKTGATLLNLTCDVEDAATGTISYTWVAGDTDIAGTYSADFVIDYGSGKKRTAPNDGEKEIVIRAALA